MSGEQALECMLTIVQVVEKTTHCKFEQIHTSNYSRQHVILTFRIN